MYFGTPDSCVRCGQGFSRLAGNDYSEASVQLARRVLDSHGLSHVQLQVGHCLVVYLHVSVRLPIKNVPQFARLPHEGRHY